MEGNDVSLIKTAGRAVVRFCARFWLALRYWLALDYSWHLAWIKAERP